MYLFAICIEAETCRGFNVLWGFDTTSAKASLVLGYSTESDTALIVTAVHIIAAHMDCHILYYHVNSESNPSDELLRD